jgi:hypothetical protein
VNASKENGKHALENLNGQERFMNEHAFMVIKEFLKAAIRKLPTEAAYEREKTKKATKS